MLIYVQECCLQRGVATSRVAVHWDELKGVGDDWKVLSWVRDRPAWINVHLYANLQAHPPFGSSLLLLKSPHSDSVLALYPVGTLSVNHNFVIITSSSGGATIQSNLRRDELDKENEAEDTAWVVCVRADGSERADVVKKAVDKARQVTAGRRGQEGITDTKNELDLSRGAGFWKGLGICTWESIRERTPPDGIIRADKDLLLSLVPEKFPVTTYLIDDGWQNISDDHIKHRRKLVSFDAWWGFGCSMAELVDKLKHEHHIRSVGVWVTLEGYWFGIDPHSELKEKYDCRRYPTTKNYPPKMGGVNDDPQKAVEDINGEMWIPSPEKAEQFWLEWFGRMKSWGIDFVKVDNQAGYDQLVGPGSLRAAAAMWQGMLNAVVKTWGSIDRVIMCMSQNEKMANGPGGLDFERPLGKLVYRTSNDFNTGLQENFPKWNLYSSILYSNLSFVADFDMFATTPETKLPVYHGLLRSLAPGPTLVSDSPHVQTDLSILRRLISVNKAGDHVVVKTEDPVAVLPNRWFLEDLQGSGGGPALVGGVPIPSASGGIIGCWNIQNMENSGQASDEIRLVDIEDLLQNEISEDEEYVLWSVGYSKANANRLARVRRGWQGGLNFNLVSGECEAVIVAKVWDIKGRKLAVLGMLDKFASLASLRVSRDNDHLLIECPLETEKLSVLALGDDVGDLHVGVDGQNTAFATSQGLGWSLISVSTDRKATTHHLETTDNWKIKVDARDVKN